MSPRSEQEQREDGLRAQVDAARLAYELARETGTEQDAALWAWKVALDAFVAAVLPEDLRR